MEEIIKVENLTKDYGDGRGIFDASFNVKRGEVFGLVGTNGAGKTTLIRHLMGFLHADSGNASITGKDCWRKAALVMRNVGYIPGEIAFPSVKTGNDFFKLQGAFLGIFNTGKAAEIAEKLNLDARASLKRMSKGMKQKSAIVTAFMGGKDILILDEPTTGLDPLMQKAFGDMILAAKKQGKTVFMSSHIFDEMEHTCDRVAVLKDGHILEIIDMAKVRGNELHKEYKIEFNSAADYKRFLDLSFETVRSQSEYNQVSIRIRAERINELFNALSRLNVKLLSYKPRTLRDEFNKIYTKSIQSGNAAKGELK
jgi:ABC-2 type transport system ATP-binding protein